MDKLIMFYDKSNYIPFIHNVINTCTTDYPNHSRVCHEIVSLLKLYYIVKQNHAAI